MHPDPRSTVSSISDNGTVNSIHPPGRSTRRNSAKPRASSGTCSKTSVWVTRSKLASGQVNACTSSQRTPCHWLPGGTSGWNSENAALRALRRKWATYGPAADSSQTSRCDISGTDCSTARPMDRCTVLAAQRAQRRPASEWFKRTNSDGPQKGQRAAPNANSPGASCARPLRRRRTHFNMAAAGYRATDHPGCPHHSPQAGAKSSRLMPALDLPARD